MSVSTLGVFEPVLLLSQAFSEFEGLFIMRTVIRCCEFDTWSLEFDALSLPLELNGRGRYTQVAEM